MESLDIGSRHRIQALKGDSAKGLQSTKRSAITEKMFDSLQCRLIATFPTIVVMRSVPDPRQQLNLAVSRDKTDN